MRAARINMQMHDQA